MATASYIKSLPPIEGHAPDIAFCFAAPVTPELAAAEFGVL